MQDRGKKKTFRKQKVTEAERKEKKAVRTKNKASAKQPKGGDESETKTRRH